MTDDDYVAVAIAAERTGLPARTLRYWVRNGKLPAIDGKGGKMVCLGDVHKAASSVGRPVAAGPLAGNETATVPTDGSVAVPATAAALMGRMAAERERADRLELVVREQAEEIGRLRERERLLEAAVEDRDRAMQSAARQDAQDDSDRARFGSQESSTTSPGYETQFQDATDALDGVFTAQERQREEHNDLWTQLAAKAAAVPEAVTQAFAVLEATQPEETPRRGVLARLFRRRSP